MDIHLFRAGRISLSRTLIRSMLSQRRRQNEKQNQQAIFSVGFIHPASLDEEA
jgi:hypothetical protein